MVDVCLNTDCGPPLDIESLNDCEKKRLKMMLQQEKEEWVILEDEHDTRFEHFHFELGKQKRCHRVLIIYMVVKLLIQYWRKI